MKRARLQGVLADRDRRPLQLRLVLVQEDLQGLLEGLVLPAEGDEVHVLAGQEEQEDQAPLRLHVVRRRHAPVRRRAGGQRPAAPGARRDQKYNSKRLAAAASAPGRPGGRPGAPSPSRCPCGASCASAARAAAPSRAPSAARTRTRCGCRRRGGR